MPRTCTAGRSRSEMNRALFPLQHDEAMVSHPQASSASAASNFITARAFGCDVAEETAAARPWTGESWGDFSMRSAGGSVRSLGWAFSTVGFFTADRPLASASL